MTKILRKTIKMLSRLKRNAHRTKKQEDIRFNNNQRNHVFQRNKGAKGSSYKELDRKQIIVKNLYAGFRPLLSGIEPHTTQKLNLV